MPRGTPRGFRAEGVAARAVGKRAGARPETSSGDGEGSGAQVLRGAAAGAGAGGGEAEGRP